VLRDVSKIGLGTDDGAQLHFARLDPLVRVLQYLGLGAKAEPYPQRLEQAACVPLQPLPDGGRWPR
jgi:hypothetical protein